MQTLTAGHLQELAEVLMKKDDEFNRLRGDFVRLQSDFRYNLNIIEERDKELRDYDISVAEMKTQIMDQEGEVRKLKTVIIEHDKSAEDDRLRRGKQVGEMENVLSTKQHEVDALKDKVERLQDEHNSYVVRVKVDQDEKITEMTACYETCLRDLQSVFREELSGKEQESKELEDAWRAKIAKNEAEYKELSSSMGEMARRRADAEAERLKLERELQSMKLESESLRSKILDLEQCYRDSVRVRREQEIKNEGELTMVKAECDAAVRSMRIQLESIERRWMTEQKQMKSNSDLIRKEKQDGERQLKKECDEKILEMQRICEVKIRETSAKFDTKEEVLRSDFERRTEKSENEKAKKEAEASRNLNDVKQLYEVKLESLKKENEDARRKMEDKIAEEGSAARQFANERDQLAVKYRQEQEQCKSLKLELISERSQLKEVKMKLEESAGLGTFGSSGHQMSNQGRENILTQRVDRDSPGHRPSMLFLYTFFLGFHLFLKSLSLRFYAFFHSLHILLRSPAHIFFNFYDLFDYFLFHHLLLPVHSDNQLALLLHGHLLFKPFYFFLKFSNHSVLWVFIDFRLVLD